MIVLLSGVYPDGVAFSLFFNALIQVLQHLLYWRTDQAGNCQHPPDQLALRNGWREDHFPHLEGGEMLPVFVNQPMEESCAATRIADNEDRLPDFLLAVTREEDLIQQEKEPVDDLRGDVEEQPDNQHQQAPECQAVMFAPALEEGFVVVTEKRAKVEVQVLSPPLSLTSGLVLDRLSSPAILH